MLRNRQSHTFVLSLFLIFTVGVYLLSTGFCRSVEIVLITVSILSITIYFLDAKSYDLLGQSILRPSLLFFLGILIISVQNTIDLLLGTRISMDAVFCSPSIIDRGLAFSISGLIASIFGYISCTNTFKRRRQKSNNYYSSLFLLQLLTIFFFLLFASSIDSSFFTGDDYIKSGDINESHTSTSEFFLGITITAFLIQYAINVREENYSFFDFIRHMPKLFILVFSLYFMLRLISGSRAPALRCFLLLLFSYIFSTKKVTIKNTTVVIGLVVGAIVFSVISYGRGLAGDNWVSRYSNGLTLFQDNSSFLPATQELANSQICNQIMISEFSESGVSDHAYGLSQLRYACVLVIPNRILNEIWPVSLQLQGSAYYLK